LISTHRFQGIELGPTPLLLLRGSTRAPFFSTGSSARKLVRRCAPRLGADVVRHLRAKVVEARQRSGRCSGGSGGGGSGATAATKTSGLGCYDERPAEELEEARWQAALGHFPIKSSVEGLTEVHQRYILGRAQGVLDRCTQKREKNSGKWGGAPNPNSWKILLGAYHTFFFPCLKNVELVARYSRSSLTLKTRLECAR